MKLTDRPWEQQGTLGIQEGLAPRGSETAGWLGWALKDKQG